MILAGVASLTSPLGCGGVNLLLDKRVGISIGGTSRLAVDP